MTTYFFGFNFDIIVFTLKFVVFENYGQYYLQVVSEHVDQLVGSENFERTIVRFDTNFSQLFLELFDKIMDFNSKNYEHKLFSILYRLASISSISNSHINDCYNYHEGQAHYRLSTFPSHLIQESQSVITGWVRR